MWKRKKSSKKDKKNIAATIPPGSPNSKEIVKEKISVVIEEENEVFETPRSQLDHIENEGSNSKDMKKEKHENTVIKPNVISEKTDKNTEERNNNEKTPKVRNDVVDNEKIPEVRNDVVDNETTPKVSIVNEVHSSNEKETEVVVPLANEDTNIDNGDVIVNDKVSENKRMDEEMKKEDDLKVITSENLHVVEDEQTVPISEVPKVVVETTQEMPVTVSVDQNMNKLNEEFHENSDSLHGVKEVEKSTSEAEKTEILEQEVDCRSTITRRATICNCCGLLDVLTSSDR